MVVMPADPLRTEMTDAQKLEFLGDWLIGAGRAMRDLQAAIQGLNEKYREKVDRPSPIAD